MSAKVSDVIKVSSFCFAMIFGLMLTGLRAEAIELPERYSMEFGGWSKHNSSDEYHYNQKHEGFGITGYWPEIYPGLEPIGNIWYMKDSHEANLVQAGAGLKYKLFDSEYFDLSVSGIIGAISRHERDYDVNGNLMDTTSRHGSFFALPYLTIAAGNAALDVAYVPAIPAAGAPCSVLFWRASVFF